MNKALPVPFFTSALSNHGDPTYDTRARKLSQKSCRSDMKKHSDHIQKYSLVEQHVSEILLTFKIFTTDRWSYALEGDADRVLVKLLELA